MRSQEIAEVFDCWIADRRLSRRKKAFLNTVYEQMEDGLTSCSPDIAGSEYCGSVDLPAGCFTIQVVASILDALEPLSEPPSRLVIVTEALVDAEHIDREEAEYIYEH